MSFRLREYECILRALLATGKPVCGVADFLSNTDDVKKIILRHDVDRRPAQAWAVAKLEKRLGVRSTFYFRSDAAGFFDSRAIELIANLGHEIGYHYEDLSFCRGSRDAALARFFRNLETLRTIAPCKTVSMHGAPLSKYDNQSLLREEDLTRSLLLGDAVASVRIFEPYYLTDTGGRWLAVESNLRDRVGICWPAHALPDDISAFSKFIITTGQPLYISTHPERWCETMPGYMCAKTADIFVNVLKAIIARVRSNGTA